MKTLLLMIVISLLYSCISDDKHNGEINKSSDPSKKEAYLKKMEEKNFSLKNNGACDDALMDSLHERSKAYIESKTLTDSNLIVSFKFKEACCQEFLGDYEITNDTLVFQYEQVNDEVCSCMCWYRYKLTINEPKNNYKSLIIKQK